MCQRTKKNEARARERASSFSIVRTFVKFIINPNRRSVGGNVIIEEIAVDAERGYIPSMVMFIF